MAENGSLWCVDCLDAPQPMDEPTAPHSPDLPPPAEQLRLQPAPDHAEDALGDRRHTEQALRESEERLRLIVDNAREYAILTLDLKRRITGWNSGAESLLGYVAERGDRRERRRHLRRGGPRRRRAAARGQRRRSTRGPRRRRALAPAQERQPLLGQRRDDGDARRRRHARRSACSRSSATRRRRAPPSRRSRPAAPSWCRRWSTTARRAPRPRRRATPRTASSPSSRTSCARR